MTTIEIEDYETIYIRTDGNIILKIEKHNIVLDINVLNDYQLIKKSDTQGKVMPWDS